LSAIKLRIPGMSRSDSLELTEFVDRESVTLDLDGIPDGTFGDLGVVTATVVVSPFALKAFIAYLVYRHRGKSFEQNIETVYPDGRIERRTVKYRDTSGEPIDTALAKELSSATGIPLDKIFGDQSDEISGDQS
jgi:hypothetical protein